MNSRYNVCRRLFSRANHCARTCKRCESKPAMTLVKPPTAVPIRAAKAVTIEPSPEDGTQTPNFELGATVRRSTEAVESYALMQKQAWILLWGFVSDCEKRA